VSGVDLVQWLGGQLDEEERIAREATPGPWQNAPTARHHTTASGRSEEAVFASPPDVGAMVVASTGKPSARQNLVNAEFIAAHDPARVLREIDAKRDLLRLAERAHDYHETFTSGFASALEGALRLFALAYADRPGYRAEEWAP
jgi:hypothetical protein